MRDPEYKHGAIFQIFFYRTSNEMKRYASKTLACINSILDGY